MNNYSELKIFNEKLLLEEIRSKKIVLTALPPRLTFEVSWACNYVCKKCCYSALSNTPGFTAVNAPSWDVSDIQRIADELFPTLRYTESTLLGEPFLYQNYLWLMDVYRKYGVYYRPTTNGSLITEEKLEHANGVIDWLKCSFDAHNRELYSKLYLNDNFNRVIENLKMFSKYRDQMTPRPWFRVGLVLMRSNMDYLIEYAKFVTEEIGVDDIEIMHLNFANPQMVDEFYFDRLDYVQQKFNELAEYCETRKIRLRLPSGKYENRTKADNSGYEKYSDCARGGDIFGSQDCLGEYYVWANEDRVNYIEAYDGSKIASCEYWTRLFFKPPTIEFGKPWLKVESCGSCSNFVFGNLKEKSFKEIYNNELFQKVRLFMYNKHELPRGKWAVPCSRCLCQESIYCESNNGPSNVGKRWFLGDDIYGEK